MIENKSDWGEYFTALLANFCLMVVCGSFQPDHFEALKRQPRSAAFPIRSCYECSLLKDSSHGKRVHEAGKREFSDFFLSRLESSFNYFEINFKRYFPYCEFFIPRAVSSTFSELIHPL